MRGALSTSILALALCGFVPGLPTALTRGAGPCDAPETEEWVRGLRDRVMASSSVAAWTVDHHGEPLRCQGSVTEMFDGVQFGFVEIGFTGAVTLRVETMPLETSIVTLRVPGGFEDETAARRMVEDYAAGVGLRIDWSEPHTELEGAESVTRYWDPDPGLNASVSFFYSEDALVAIGVSMAL